MQTDAFRYEVLRELTDVEAVSVEWDSLVGRSQCNRAFSSSTWFLAACRVNPMVSPYVMVARRGETLAGVFPLALRNQGREAAFSSNLSDYNDIIAAEDDVPAAAGLLNFARCCADGYEKLVLRCLRPDSMCVRAAHLLDPAFDAEQSFLSKGGCPYIRLAPSYEDYLAARPRRFRKGLRSAERQAERERLTVRELHLDRFSPSLVAEAFLSLNLSRFGARSCFASADAQSYARSLLPNLFAQGRMRVFALFAKERMIGIDLCMVGTNSLCAWNGGFLPEAGLWSPGKLLMAEEIRQAFALKLEEYDLLRGNEAYKANWATDTRSIGRLEFAVRR